LIVSNRGRIKALYNNVNFSESSPIFNKTSSYNRSWWQVLHCTRKKPYSSYKGIPLLRYEMNPVAEMIAFVVPDWLPDLIPGEYPHHDNTGKVLSNFKGTLYNLPTGEYDSFGIPVPMGHIWDSILRVLAGLFLALFSAYLWVCSWGCHDLLKASSIH
jgi:hypothetical protein